MKIFGILLISCTILPVNAAEDVYYARAVQLMEETPLVDTHVDLPQIIRSLGM